MSHHGISALIVEDDSDLQDIYRDVFRRIGISSITTCSDGNDALQRLKEGKFDLIVLDYHIPGKTGLQILSAIVADPKNFNAKRYFVSGYLSPRVQDEIRAFRVDRVFPKPFELKDFSAAVAADLFVNENPSPNQELSYETFSRVVDSKFRSLDANFQMYPGVFSSGILMTEHFRSMIPIFGDRVFGTISLSFSLDAVVRYLNKVFESTSNIDRDLVADAVCELTNQVAGQFKIELSNLNLGRIRLGLPISDKFCQLIHPVPARVFGHNCEFMRSAMIAEIAVGRDD